MLSCFFLLIKIVRIKEESSYFHHLSYVSMIWARGFLIHWFFYILIHNKIRRSRTALVNHVEIIVIQHGVSITVIDWFNFYTLAFFGRLNMYENASLKCSILEVFMVQFYFIFGYFVVCSNWMFFTAYYPTYLDQQVLDKVWYL